MSQTNGNQPTENAQPNAPQPEGTQPDDFAPPDDFGASVIAEFQRRAEGSNGDAGGTPPGGWPELPTPETTTPAAPAAPDLAGTGEGASASVPGSTDAGAAAPAVETPAAGTTTAPTAGDPAAVAPAAGTIPESPVEPPAPAGYTYRYQDGAETREHVFSDQEVQNALSLSAWANGLPEATKTAIGAIETGQAVAIPRADYDQYVAWKNTQSRSTRDADLAQFDEDAAKLIAEQRDLIDTLKAQTNQAPQPQVDLPQAHAQLNNDAQIMGQAMQTYAQSRGLNDAEVTALMDVAVRANVIPTLVESNSIYNPVTRQVAIPADLAAVTEQALDWALIRNPGLKTRVLSAQPAAPAPATPAADPVAAKKARAASVATAASGAPAPAPVTTRTMSEDDRVRAMAREIEAAMAAS